jgi:hypothetical protein
MKAFDFAIETWCSRFDINVTNFIQGIEKKQNYNGDFHKSYANADSLTQGFGYAPKYSIEFGIKSSSGVCGILPSLFKITLRQHLAVQRRNYFWLSCQQFLNFINAQSISILRIIIL